MNNKNSPPIFVVRVSIYVTHSECNEYKKYLNDAINSGDIMDQSYIEFYWAGVGGHEDIFCVSMVSALVVLIWFIRYVLVPIREVTF